MENMTYEVVDGEIRVKMDGVDYCMDVEYLKELIETEHDVSVVLIEAVLSALYVLDGVYFGKEETFTLNMQKGIEEYKRPDFKYPILQT